MQSRNYTYEKKKVTKTGACSLGWILGRGYAQDELSVRYKAWVILNPKGRKIAEATSEKQAEIIVAALNGVAP